MLGIAAAAMTTAVGHDDAIMARQQWRHRAPIGLACHRRAMDQDERGVTRSVPIAPEGFVVDAGAVNLKEGH